MENRRVVECLTSTVAKGILQDCLEDGYVIPSRHFREKLVRERLDFEDVWHVLRTGQIYDAGEFDIKPTSGNIELKAWNLGED